MAVSSAALGGGVSPTPESTFTLQPVRSRTSSAVCPGWTVSTYASPPPSGNRNTHSVVMIADGPPPRSPLRSRHPAEPSPSPGEVMNETRSTRRRCSWFMSVTHRRLRMAMSAPPPLPGSLTRGREGSPTYDVFKFPKQSTSPPPMKPRSTLSCAISAIVFDIRVAHTAPATLGGSPIVPRKASAGRSRMSPTSNSPRAFGACVSRATAYANIGSRMPTNTRSPSWISREATATISSCAVWASLIAEIDRRRVTVIANAQRVHIDLFQIARTVGHVQYPAPEPARKAILGARLLRVVAIERVVALEVSLHRGRVRPARFMNNGHHLGLRQQDPIWIAEDDGRIDKLLAGDDHLFRGQPSLLGDSQRPPDMRAPHPIGALRVDDGDVRPHRPDVDEAKANRQIRIRPQDVATQERACRKARHVPGRRPQGERDREI